jgi:tetratricopeptide (TPR) repeat protein
MRARMLAARGDRRGAEAAIRAGLGLPADDEPTWLARGLARLDSDPEGALDDFEAALRLNPRSVPALQNAAHVLALRPEGYEPALARLDRAVELAPGNVGARVGRGILRARLGRRDEALADAREALRRDGSPATLYGVAGIYAQTSRRVSADAWEARRLLADARGAGYDPGFPSGLDPDLAPLEAPGSDSPEKEAAR